MPPTLTLERALIAAPDHEAPAAGPPARRQPHPSGRPRRYVARHAAPTRKPVLLPVLLLGVSAVVVGVVTLPGGAGGPAQAATTPPADPAPLLNLSATVDAELALAAVAPLVADGVPSNQAALLVPPPVPVPAPPAVVAPVTGPVTSPFGYRWGRLHAGIDFGVPVGTPVLAVEAGVVQRVSSSRGGYGNLTVLQHPDGTLTFYAHQSQLLVAEGQPVTAGQQIGLSGNTGHSTGPHLHFEVRPGGGDPVDPRAWLAGHGTPV